MSGWTSLFSPEPAKLFGNAPPSLRKFYSLFDGVATVIDKAHVQDLLSNPKKVHGKSTFYVYPVRAWAKAAGYDGLVTFGRVDAACQACFLRSTNSVAYLDKAGEIEVVNDETPIEFANDTILTIAGSWDHAIG